MMKVEVTFRSGARETLVVPAKSGAGAVIRRIAEFGHGKVAYVELTTIK